MAGFGTITWWGFSPPLDLLQEIETMNNRRNIDIPYDKELNVLLVGAADIRHIFKTIAQRHRHGSRKINFYVIENNLEVVCRDMLLLKLLTEPTAKMGFQDKMEMFLEIFGNSLIRHHTCVYVQEASKEFKKMITDTNYLEEKLPFLDINLFRYKERDSMEGVFNFWKNPDINLFDIRKFWEHRQRQYLGTRYDSRVGAFDWDYNMKLTDKDAGIINYHQYKKWRNTGVAFELRDANYNVPNKTLASGLIIKHEGDSYLKRGYWGDIVTGPYIAAFGIECDDKTFFEKKNNAYYKTAQDVASRNVVALLHEMLEHEKYKKTNANKGKGDRLKKDQGNEFCFDKKNQAKLTEIHEVDENSDTQSAEDNVEFCTKQKAHQLDGKSDSTVATNRETLKISSVDMEQPGAHQKHDDENQFIKDAGSVGHEISLEVPKLEDDARKPNGSITDSIKKKEWRLQAGDRAEPETESVGGQGDQRKKEKKSTSETCDKKVNIDIAKDIAKDCHIYFMSQKFLLDMHQRERFCCLFNLVFYANSMVHVLKPEMKAILAPDAVLLLETAKFLIDLRKEQVTEFVGKLVTIAGSMGCKAAIPCDPQLDTVARFYCEVNEN